MDLGNSPRVKLTENFMDKLTKIVHLETAEYNKIYKLVFDFVGYLNLKHFIAEIEEEIENDKLATKNNNPLE
jgi:hypothetical protein